MPYKFKDIKELVDLPWLAANTEALWKRELGQCFRNYREAADFTAGLCRQAGLAEVEKIAFPADGSTTFQDKTMPLAWDAGCGKLTVVQSPIPFDDPVVADYRLHPFHVWVKKYIL